MKQILILLLLTLVTIPTQAQNFENIQTPKFTTQSKKVIDLNLVMPTDWKIDPRIDNQELIIRKDVNNFINLNISDYIDKPKNTICYNKADYKILDTKLLRKKSSTDTNTNIQEYIFRKQDATTFGPILLNYTTTKEDLEKLEVEGSKAFYVKQNNEYVVKLPTLGEVYELCDVINNLGPVNINNNFQYIIKSQSSDEANQKIIDSIVVKSNWGNNLIPDQANQQTPITAISKTVGTSDKSNINIFFLFFGLLGAFSFMLVYMTRLRNIEK
jgi:hypothetical protein